VRVLTKAALSCFYQQWKAGQYHTKNNDDNGQNNCNKDNRLHQQQQWQCEGDSNSCNDSTPMEQQCNNGNGNDIIRMATLTTTMPMQWHSSNSSNNDKDTKVAVKAEMAWQQQQQCHNNNATETVVTTWQQQWGQWWLNLLLFLLLLFSATTATTATAATIKFTLLSQGWLL